MAALSPLNLLEIQVEALFSHDRRGRIIASNEIYPAPAPRLFLGRTIAGNVWRVRADLPESLVATLEPILAAEPPLNDPVKPPHCLGQLHAVLEAHQPVTTTHAGPAFVVPDDVSLPAGARLLDIKDVALLAAFRDEPDAEPPNGLHLTLPWSVVMHGDVVASFCCSSRLTPRAAEAGLETLPPFRGRGYGTVAAAGWASAIRATGRVPLYSTAWENVASRAVARRLGLVFYGVDWSID